MERLTGRNGQGKATIIFKGKMQDKSEEELYLGIDKIVDRLAELEDKLESGELVELPCLAMVEQGLVDGRFEQTQKAQQFNGRYAVVYLDKKKYHKPLIDICWSKGRYFNIKAAEARLKELRGEK